MDTTKKRIKKIATLLSIICQISSICLKIAMIGSLVAIAIVYINPDLVSKADVISNASVFSIIDQFARQSGVAKTHRVAIALFIAFLSFLAARFYVNFFKNFLSVIANGERPFTLSLAKKLKKVSWAMLLIILYSPGFGIMLFLITLLFSYLFEYGAYLQEKADETNHIQEEIILSFAEISENKSGQTGQHIRRVAEYSKIIAEEMGLEPEQAEALRLASTMHDIGKLLIPSEILDKPGRLTDEEYKVIKKHTTYGGQMLDGVEGEIMALARSVALEHHERVDGKGYPNGKSGEDISLEGRIVAVADVYDALTSRRSYKEAWDAREAYNEIVKCSGTQFDENVVEAFKKSYDRIDEIRKRYADESAVA